LWLGGHDMTAGSRFAGDTRRLFRLSEGSANLREKMICKSPAGPRLSECHPRQNF
jgi:hypothetical protein